MKNLKGKAIIITGAAKRIGKAFALAAAKHGASIILHYGKSEKEALQTAEQIRVLGVQVDLLQSNFSEPPKALSSFQDFLSSYQRDIYALVNNASLFAPLKFFDTDFDQWNNHMNINLSVPFLLTKLFAKHLGERKKGKVINILDWRALRPGKDHFPYTISKSGLLALTKSTAIALAPNIQVNGIALGAILPPSNGGGTDTNIQPVPMRRWADISELTDTFMFLLNAPDYITGEIIHVDGGRHLV